MFTEGNPNSCESSYAESELYPTTADPSRAATASRRRDNRDRRLNTMDTIVRRTTYRMSRFDLTLPTPAQNLAFDEALLELAEEELTEGEFLRLWEPPQPMVVVGRSTRVQIEVNEQYCREEQIPIVRRSSGGAAIVTGRGCLMYALVLSYKTRPELKDITRAHGFILNRLATSLTRLLSDFGSITCAGTSDLTLSDQTLAATARKFSGNSLRVKRTHLLYHGTLLYAFDLGLIEKCLRMPPRQPNYRNARPHADFVMNVPATRQQLVDAVIGAFPMAREPEEIPLSRVERLVTERFGNDRWNYEFA
jgi:lipoate---protein ligase